MGADGTTHGLTDRAALERVLTAVLDRIGRAAPRFDMRLVGTGAALAQGVRTSAGDVDVLVADRSDVDVAAAALSGLPCPAPPVWLPDARQYFTRFEVQGIAVEFSTVEGPTDIDTAECAGPGPWKHSVPVPLGQHVVQAVRLELRLVTEIVRDRPDRRAPLLEHLRSHGADLPLLRQALADHGVDPALRERVLDRLT
ncbi:hypothetical protein [Streptomyces avicenniae]|uniref:hypothetical protein n=1 Tax=Streptomyces avicenniae TaxID=500153 RepID=UPI000699AE33|nr:hypothetical protein [Streptomyces avicenniae]